MESTIQITTDAQGVSVVSAAHDGNRYVDRSRRVQIVQVELVYGDGSTGEMNLTAPHTSRGEDIEQQAIALRAYLNHNAQVLGIVRHHFHAYLSRPDGSLRKSWSWFPYDCVSGEEIRPTTNDQPCRN